MLQLKLAGLVTSEAMLSLSFRVIPVCGHHACTPFLCLVGRRAVSLASRLLVLSRSRGWLGHCCRHSLRQSTLGGYTPPGAEGSREHPEGSTQKAPPGRLRQLLDRKLSLGQSFRKEIISFYFLTQFSLVEWAPSRGMLGLRPSGRGGFLFKGFARPIHWAHPG